MNEEMLRLILPALRREQPDSAPSRAGNDDRTLILLLILLLMKEKCDTYLLLALLYILK